MKPQPGTAHVADQIFAHVWPGSGWTAPFIHAVLIASPRSVLPLRPDALSYTCSGSWVDEANNAASEVSDFSSVGSALSALKTAAATGDLAAAKGKFVAATSALQSWSSAAGIANQLRGL